MSGVVVKALGYATGYTPSAWAFLFRSAAAIRRSRLRMGRYLWSQKLTGLHAAHSATTFLSGMPGMSMRRVCGVELRAFVRRAVPCRGAPEYTPRGRAPGMACGGRGRLAPRPQTVIAHRLFRLPAVRVGSGVRWRARAERILTVSSSWGARASTARRAPPL